MEAFFTDPQLQRFFLIFARLSGLVAFVPPFFNRRISLQLKGGMVFFLAVAMFPAVDDAAVILEPTFPDLGIAMCFEMLIGVIIGFVIDLMFMAYQLAGTLMGRQMGFAMASLVDPQNDINVSIIGSILQNFALFFFLFIGGHLWVINTFAGSFKSIPLLETSYAIDGLMYQLSGLFFKSVKFAVEVALPISLIMILIQMSLGYISRTVPQLQVFVVGFIFTISVGIISLQITLHHLTNISYNFFDIFFQDLWFIISHLKDG